MMDIVVGDTISLVFAGGRSKRHAIKITAAGSYAAAAQIPYFVSLDSVTGRSVPQAQAHAADVGNAALDEITGKGMFQIDGRFDKAMAGIFLAANGNITAKQTIVAPGRQRPIDIFQLNPPEMQVDHRMLPGSGNRQ
ncbi:MAG: hypothetical protein BWY71_02292 [Planctomycetes bacterium ADurb.Bin412]|nr:MAG: hypothetical protein BWY71_02292 [Planctomycetes bacterium ADurb.Bin412]